MQTDRIHGLWWTYQQVIRLGRQSAMIALWLLIHGDTGSRQAAGQNSLWEVTQRCLPSAIVQPFVFYYQGVRGDKSTQG